MVHDSVCGLERFGCVVYTRYTEVMPLDYLADEVYARLVRAGCVAADEEASDLLAAAPDEATLAKWVTRREHGEPLAWILGRIEFCGLSILVDERLYVPRLQSEELARRAAERLPRDGCAADLCTGVGAIAAYLGQMAPNATVVGTDLNLSAVRCARRNGVQAIVSELGSSLHSGAFDVVSVVAPYVPTGQLRLLPADVQRFEPTLALDGGADGLTQLRRSVFDAQRLLHAGGWFLAEVGGVQDRMLEPVLRSAGFDNFLSWHDEDGDLRGVCAQLI